MIADDLLQLLACPETKQPLSLASSDTVSALNEKIAAGSLRNRSGEPVSTALDAGLVREDGRILYPVQDEIPILLVEEGIELSGAS